MSPSDPRPGESVTFDASGSTDDSAITSYSWDFGDGTNGSGEVVTHTYTASRDYTVTLTVTDDDGATDTTATTLSVSNADFDVTIKNTSSPVTAGETLTVNATINNTGNAAGTQEVTLSINGTEEDRQTVSLTAGETTTLPFTWSTSAGDAQDNPYNAVVASENESATRSVSVVQQQADLQINNVSGLSNQTSSHNYQVDVDVEELNNVQTQNLAVRLVIEDSSGTEAFNVTKTAPENFSEIQNEEITVGFDVGQLRADSYSYSVRAVADNAQTATAAQSFTVRPPGFNGVTASNLSANSNSEIQELTATLDGSLPDGEAISLDLSDAQWIDDSGQGNPKVRVDYRSASVSVTSGSGSASFTTNNADSAVITYTAGPGGDGDGSQIRLTVSDIETGPKGQQLDIYTVPFDRSDGGTATATFSVN